MEAPALTPAESVALLHALVDFHARDLGVRALFIKGPTLTAQGLRAPHDSVDVDVLVDPSRLPAMVDRLAELGWAEPVTTTAPIVDQHSVTLRHPSWGCELDVHDRFPGFLAEPQDVFEVLWEHRATITLAHRPLPCPDLTAHAAVAALHWLRDGLSPATEEKLSYLTAALRDRLDQAGIERLGSVAARTGATEPLRPLLDALDLSPIGDSTYDSTRWRIRTASTGVKSVGWVLELTSTPLRHLPARLAHALLLTEAEIRREQPNAAPGARGLFRARLRRLGYGLRDLPRAVRIVWKERRRR
jgi:hypothetical protein